MPLATAEKVEPKTSAPRDMSLLRRHLKVPARLRRALELLGEQASSQRLRVDVTPVSQSQQFWEASLHLGTSSEITGCHPPVDPLKLGDP